MRTVASSEIIFVRGDFVQREKVSEGGAGAEAGEGAGAGAGERERPMIKLHQILHLVASVGSVGLVKLPPVCTSGARAGEDVP